MKNFFLPSKSTMKNFAENEECKTYIMTLIFLTSFIVLKPGQVRIKD